jgi:hypothetical protein
VSDRQGGGLVQLNPQALRVLSFKIGLKHESGWDGLFTRQQIEGAIENGARIFKFKQEDKDSTPLGTEGTVLGSMEVTGTIGYFVEWDIRPRTAVFVIAEKIQKKGSP